MGQTSTLSPEALIEILSLPDWRVDFARVGHALGEERSLKRATLNGGSLTFEFGTHVYSVPIEAIQHLTPWHIRVLNTYEEKRMRKLADGGGWHNVRVLQRSIWLSNPRIKEECTRKGQRTARVRLERESAAKEAAKQKARGLFVEYYNDCFKGEEFSHVSFLGDDFCIHFESGKKTQVEAKFCNGLTTDGLLRIGGWIPEEFGKN